MSEKQIDDARRVGGSAGLIRGAVAVLYAIIQLVYFAPVAMLPAVGFADWLSATVALAASVPVLIALIVPRIPPIWIVAACAASIVLSLPIYPLGTVIAAAYAVYAVVSATSVRAGWLSAGALVASSVLAIPLAQLAPIWAEREARGVAVFGLAVTAVLSIAVAVTIAALIGTLGRARATAVAALQERNAQLESEREARSELAVLAERSRIAAELHDIVGHSLSVMVSLADGAVLVARDEPDRAIDAMAAIAESGRVALAETRRVLSTVHRGGAGGFEPVPGQTDIADLVDSFRSAGLPVEYSLAGAIPEDRHVQLTSYRIVQEALTNVLRHAGTVHRVCVWVTNADTIEVVVIDDGAEATPSSDGGGFGIVGMRERVAAFGGLLEAGPNDGGVGWRVRAVLPGSFQTSRTKAARSTAARSTAARSTAARTEAGESDA
jgi:signal transduction histidine kinase